MANSQHAPQFTVVIPARYNSTRFPGKPLVDIHGKPMIQHVYDRAMEARAGRVVVATDDKRIADVVKGFGGEVCMTRPDHQSGTERLAEVVELLSITDLEIVVNVQGDEPFIPAPNILQVATNLAQHADCEMATLAAKIDDPTDVNNPNAVKVVTDKIGRALYFSRASIPFDRDGQADGNLQPSADVMRRHVGIYAYKASYIRQYVSYQPSPLEGIEHLEQLRALWYGDNIHVALAVESPPVGIDTPEDLKKLITREN